MDKITRMLILYSKLIKGEPVQKAIFCFENECSPRTFDRDIEDVRLFLSESYSATELLYDRKSDTYYIEGAGDTKFELTEYLFLRQLLKNTSLLRKDEYSSLHKHLLANTNITSSARQYETNLCEKYNPPTHNQAILKIHGDLESVIREGYVIKISYLSNGIDAEEIEIIPCEIKLDLNGLYCIGYKTECLTDLPESFKLEKIVSFVIIRKQSFDEKCKVAEYIENYLNDATHI